MSDSSVESSVLSSLISSYEAYDAEDTSTTSDGTYDLGTEDFLTLLMAQLENQNPLDPADTDAFTDQLAQFTQVEQLININDKLEDLESQIAESEDDVDANSYVGLTVTASVTSMTIDDGTVTAGFYEVENAAEVRVYVYDEDGNKVATLSQGEVEEGSYLVSWDGTDDQGNELEDGEYDYVVVANYGDGYEEVKSYLTGTVDSVSYQNGKAYLVVSGILIDPENVTTVSSSSSSNSDDTTSILEYLGTTVSTNYPIVQVEDSDVQGEALTYNLETSSSVTITIYNSDDEVVDTIEVSADDTAAGENEVTWDGLTSDGYQASDGLYYYKVEADTGDANTSTTGEVTAIKYVNGTQYLVIGESGRLVSVSSITSVE